VHPAIQDYFTKSFIPTWIWKSFTFKWFHKCNVHSIAST